MLIKPRQLLYLTALSVACFRTVLYSILALAPHLSSPSRWLGAVFAELSNHPALAGWMILCGLTLAALVFLNVRERRALVQVLASREGATIALGMALVWAAPMVLGSGALLTDDWGPQLRAALQALDRMRQFHAPAFTFLYENGASYTLQYPPLATLLVAGLAFVTHLPVEFCFKLLCLLMHGLFLVGGYRLLRLFRMPRVPAVSGVILVSLTQQYWATAFAHGAVPSFIASSLLPLLLWSLGRALQTGAARYGALLGCILGCMIMAQPIAGLFAVYTLAIALFGLLLFRFSQTTRAWRAAAITAVAALSVGAPFITTVLAFRPYNHYQFAQISAFYFPPISILRWFWWHPQIGLPPGVGSDNSGYVGFAIAAANLIAVVVAWSRIRTLTAKVYLACLIWGCLLVYGMTTGVFHVIPFGYLAKGTYRLWPFLSIALMLGVGFAATWLLERHRHAACTALVVLGLVENAAFSLKPAFHSPPTKAVDAILAEVPQGDRTLPFLIAPDRTLLESVYREMSLSRRPDFYYIHHEEVGALAKRYWELNAIFGDAKPNTDWRRSEEELRWFGVTHLIVLGRDTSDYAGLAPIRSKIVDGRPVAIIPIPHSRPIQRASDGESIEVDASDLRPDGRIRLPVSYHPLLQVTSDSHTLATQSEAGFLTVCCVSAPGMWLRVTAGYPLWLDGLWLLSGAFMLGTLSAFAVSSRRARSRALGSAVQAAAYA